MKFHCSLMEPRCSTPDPAAWASLFSNYDPAFWVAEAEGGVLTFIDPQRKIQYDLTIMHVPDAGFVVQYAGLSTAKKSKGVCRYMVGDRANLAAFVDVYDDLYYPLGCIVKPAQAWVGVEEFLRNPAMPASRADWVNDSELNWPIV